MSTRKKNLIGSVIASVLSLCGCGQDPPPPSAAQDEPTLIEEIKIAGFDADGEPTIKKWSDGSLSIHFEAMPPFFAEDDGTESEFDAFAAYAQVSCGRIGCKGRRRRFEMESQSRDPGDDQRSANQTIVAAHTISNGKYRCEPTDPDSIRCICNSCHSVF